MVVHSSVPERHTLTSCHARAGSLRLKHVMKNAPLTTYLRTERKRLGLSQNELAYLGGTKGHASVSRYESASRLPTLETSFAYEIVFDVPLADLYVGQRQATALDVARRLQTLIGRIRRQRATPVRDAKLVNLEKILGRLN